MTLIPLHRKIWELGVSLRNPSFGEHLRSLKSTELISIDELSKLQYLKAKETLCHAYTNSVFYLNLFNGVDFNPLKDFQSIEDIIKVPVIDKKDLINYGHLIQSIQSNKNAFVSETSGSTGHSLKFLKDENWDSFNRAARARGFSWYNVKPWDKNGYLWGYNFSMKARLETAFFDAIQNRFRLFSYSENEIRRFAERLSSSVYICGYSSMIYEVAKRVNAMTGITRPLNLKMVCGTSEKIFESYQVEAEKAFGRKIIGEYGAAEAGIIAFECPHGNLHINMEGVFVEEENGEILVTNLVARSFPIIRYKLGDYIKLKDPSYECPCGMKHRVIESVLGRVGKLIYGRDHTYPSLTFYYVFKNLAINQNIELNYQAEQKKRGEIVLNIEQQLKPLEMSSLEKELTKYFKSDISFEVHSGKPIHQMQGKFMDFVSHID